MHQKPNLYAREFKFWILVFLPGHPSQTQRTFFFLKQQQLLMAMLLKY